MNYLRTIIKYSNKLEGWVKIIMNKFKIFKRKWMSLNLSKENKNKLLKGLM